MNSDEVSGKIEDTWKKVLATDKGYWGQKSHLPCAKFFKIE